jgi:hypothetical protein
MTGRQVTPELRAEIDRQVDAAPPPNDEQKARLYALFAPVRRPAPTRRRSAA